MATRLSLRRVGDSTGKLIAAPDSVAELLEKATKKLKLPSDAKRPAAAASSRWVWTSLIVGRGVGRPPTGRVRGIPDQPINSLRTLVRPRHDQPTNSAGFVRHLGCRRSLVTPLVRLFV